MLCHVSASWWLCYDTCSRETELHTVQGYSAASTWFLYDAWLIIAFVLLSIKICHFYQIGFVGNLTSWYKVGRKKKQVWRCFYFIYLFKCGALSLISLILFLPFIPHAPPQLHYLTSKSSSVMFLCSVPGYCMQIGDVTAKHGEMTWSFMCETHGEVMDAWIIHLLNTNTTLANQASYDTHTTSSGNFISLPSQQKTGRTLNWATAE